MTTSNLTDYSSTPVAQSPADRFDQYRNPLIGDLVPRNSSGIPASGGGNLGTALYPWANAYLQELTIDGRPFDPLNRVLYANQIRSGRTRTGSSQPLFLKPSGSTNEATILAADTDLSLVINNAAVVFNTDVTISALSVAPSTGNTCLVNDSNLSGQEASKYIRTIPIDTIGAEISALNGKLAAFKISTEVFIARVDTTNNYLQVVTRGWFFDSADAPIARVAVSNNDTITLVKLGWVYADDSGTAASVSYTEPVYSGTEPATGITNDYWLDLDNDEWKRYTGSSWVSISRTFLGWVVCNTTACIAARSADFTLMHDSTNTIAASKASVSTVQSLSAFENYISVYANNMKINSRLVWNMATDLESGVTEAISTTYYFYITESGAPKISDQRPIWREELMGMYHPWHTWRWVATATNDGSADLGECDRSWNDGLEIITPSTDGVWNVPEWVWTIDIDAIAGGGAGGLARYQSVLFDGYQGGTSGNQARAILDISEALPLRNYLLAVGAGGVAATSQTIDCGGGETSFGSLIVLGGGPRPVVAAGAYQNERGTPSSTLTVNSGLKLLEKSYGRQGAFLNTGSGDYPDFDPIGGQSKFQFGNLATVGQDACGYGGGGNGHTTVGSAGDGFHGVIIIRYKPIK